MNKQQQSIINQFRRYVDGFYTRDEAEQLIDGLTRQEDYGFLLPVFEEVWQESEGHSHTSEEENALYRQEALLLISPKKNIDMNRRKTIRYVAAVAATLLLFIGVPSILVTMFFGTASDYVELRTSFGEHKEITLPDGSLITMNACSSLKYPKRFAKDMRKVELEGEAFFDVRKNEKAPFIVQLSPFDVQVLGTSFNIKSYAADEVRTVTVKTGKVRIDLPDAQLQVRAAEEMVYNIASEEYQKQKKTGDVALWRKGYLSFDRTPIKDVARELERHYNCMIDFERGTDFNNYISGEHDNKRLEDVLDAIEFITNIKYNKQGNRILLYKKQKVW